MNYSFGVDIINCRMEGNDTAGVIIGTESGANHMVDTLVSGNGNLGVLIGGGSALRCWGCTVDSDDEGFELQGGSELQLSNSTVQGRQSLVALFFGLQISAPGRTRNKSTLKDKPD
jgi:hypothetical protein